MSTSESKETTAADIAPVAVQEAQPAVETGLSSEPAGDLSEEEDALPQQPELDENGEILTPPQVPGSQPRGRIRPPTQGGSGKPTSGRPK